MKVKITRKYDMNFLQNDDDASDEKQEKHQSTRDLIRGFLKNVFILFTHSISFISLKYIFFFYLRI